MNCTDRQETLPSPSCIGTCDGFRGAVHSSVGTCSRATYRALVANAVITKQSCSRIKKKKNKVYIKKKGQWRIESFINSQWKVWRFLCIFVNLSLCSFPEQPCLLLQLHANAKGLSAATCACKTNHAPPGQQR